MKISVVVQGVIIPDATCTQRLCLDIATHSPDANGDLVVNLLDFSLFGAAWTASGGVYDPCLDFDCNGTISLVDFSVLGQHWQHGCF